MQNPKSIVAALLVLVALAGAKSAEAQIGSDGMGGSGNHSLYVSPADDSYASAPTTSFRLDLLTRFRVGMFSSFSWGRGAWGRPGLLRSSTAVLRERRGLMLR